MRYFTSDTHYGHRNIIEFCQRPYADVRQMDEELVDRVTSTLSLEDELWHLGDVALGHLDDTLPNLARITADVTLVAGNHDRCHPYNGVRSARFVDIYRDKCKLTDLILTNSRLTLQNGVEAQVSHFPHLEPAPVPAYDQRGRPIKDKFAEWRPVDDGSWLLCGHVHDRWRQHGHMINVGVDAWAGVPVSEETLCEMIEAGPTDLPPLPWE